MKLNFGHLKYNSAPKTQIKTRKKAQNYDAPKYGALYT